MSATKHYFINAGCGMIEKTLEEFVKDCKQLTVNAALNDDFVEIDTGKGKAILISEGEWQILKDAFVIAINK